MRAVYWPRFFRETKPIGNWLTWLWTKAGRSQDRQGEPTSYRPRSARYRFSLKALQAREPGRTDVSVQVWSQKDADGPVLKQSGSKPPLIQGRVSFVFHAGLQLIGWGPPTPGRATCFMYSADINSSHTPNTVTETPRAVFDKYLGIPWFSQVDP